METINDFLRKMGVAKMETTTKESLGIGNAAKMREALVKIRKVMDEMSKSIFQGWIEDSLVDIMGEAQRAISSALSAPPRNCDLYATEDDAWRVFLSVRQGVDFSTEEYEKWLFEQAKGETK